MDDIEEVGHRVGLSLNYPHDAPFVLHRDLENFDDFLVRHIWYFVQFFSKSV